MVRRTAPSPWRGAPRARVACRRAASRVCDLDCVQTATARTRGCSAARRRASRTK
jgi:hypothetical protein